MGFGEVSKEFHRVRQSSGRLLIRRGEAIVIGLLGVALLVLFERINAFERFSEFIEGHEAYQLDEVFFTICLGGIAALYLAIRRSMDLRLQIEMKEAAEQRAIQLARHDPLTSLANRRVLEEDFGRLVADGRAAASDYSVFLIDLDHFKPVNDVHGHETGDDLLVEVAGRLRLLAGPDGRIYRLGGDEFVCLKPEAESGTLRRFADQVIQALSEPFDIGGRRIVVGATVGVARFPLDGRELQDLLRGADIAMYEAKNAGRGKYRFFNAEMDYRFQLRAELETHVRLALANGEIVPFFQPVYDLAQSRIVGFEALARWIHPSRGILEPTSFLPVIEDLGLSDQLTEQILRLGAATAKRWPQDLTLSINIAPSQLEDSDLSTRILLLLAEAGLPPERLIVEVTENAIITDTAQAADVFASLQNAGIRTALDDFGKGYSSLSHLRQLRFNHLKIDSSFIQSMASSESQKIVGAVTELGKALGMHVIAEGVDTSEAADVLRALGCERAQGFLFGNPMPAEEAIALVATLLRD